MSHDSQRRYGLDIVQAAGVVGFTSDDSKAQVISGASSTENPFDSGPGGVNQKASGGASNSNMAPGFDPSAATCLLTCMFREDFANFIARCSTINMCGRSLVGQSLHNLSLPRAQFDRRVLLQLFFNSLHCYAPL